MVGFTESGPEVMDFNLKLLIHAPFECIMQPGECLAESEQGGDRKRYEPDTIPAAHTTS